MKLFVFSVESIYEISKKKGKKERMKVLKDMCNVRN